MQIKNIKQTAELVNAPHITFLAWNRKTNYQAKIVNMLRIYGDEFLALKSSNKKSLKEIATLSKIPYRTLYGWDKCPASNYKKIIVQAFKNQPTEFYLKYFSAP